MRKSIFRVVVLAALLVLLGLSVGKIRTLAAEPDYPDIKPGETAESERISVNGIEFVFDKKYTVGKFENGDYWVYGVNASVWINEMSPAYNSETQSNGWEINPKVTGGQGFVGGEGTGFDSSLVPKLPYRFRGTMSVVKAVSTGGANPKIEKAAVLTIVENKPKDNGSGVFRPAYVGSTKEMYSLSGINTAVLQNFLDPVKGMPSDSTLTEMFSKVRLEHKVGEVDSILRSFDSIEEEKADNEAIVAAAISLMTDYDDTKQPLLINYLQYCIDRSVALTDGAEPLHFLTASFASRLLNKGFKYNVARLETSLGQNLTEGDAGVILFGDKNGSKDTIVDPNGMIDGGDPSKGQDQAILSAAAKMEALAFKLIPTLKESWPADARPTKEWLKIEKYAERYACFGLWTLPDDSESGARYPKLHGTKAALANSQNPYQSDWIDTLWDTAYTKASASTQPFGQIINVSNNAVLEGTKTLQASAYGINGVASVQFCLDGGPLMSAVTKKQTVQPYAYELTVDFTKVSSGMHILNVIVTDEKGNTYQSKGIDFTVKGGAAPSGLVPVIDVRPGQNVRVNEEVFLTGERSTYTDMAHLGRSKFAWDFGDGYALENNGTMDSHGNSVIHYYMKPGTYVVTLTISIYSDKDGNNLPIGDVIAKRKEQVTITVTGEAPMAGYELLHAPFNTRIAQFITASIPDELRSNTNNKLTVTLIGKNSGTRRTVFEKQTLALEEKFLVDYSTLPADEYTLQAQITNGSGKKLDGGLWEEYFSKSYDGIPRVGINEWNAICIDGEPFFPVTPFMTNGEDFTKFEGTVNTTYTVGYYNETPNHNHSPKQWSHYLGECAKKDWMAIGPGRGDYTVGIGRNKNITRMQDFVAAAKDNSSMLAWCWCDEPNMGGRSMMTPMPVLAAWNYATHEIDDEHPVTVNMVCDNGQTDGHYAYANSAQFTGRHFHLADIIQFDHYPLEARWHAYLFNKDEGIMALWVEYFDWIQEYSGNMLPNGAFIEVCDIFADKGTPAPSGSQVLMEAWLAVVHGMKMVNWFPFFSYGTIQYEAMREFTTGVTTFDNIILGPDLPEAEWITDDSNVRNNRVDTLTKKDGDDLYLFTVRLTEPVPTSNETKALLAYDEDKIITTTFTVPNMTDGTAVVLNASGRVTETIPIKNGKFSDTYNKEEYRIYKITKSGVVPPIPGDVDGSGKVDVADVSLVAKHIGKTSSGTDWQSIKKCDMNGDNRIDIADLSTVAKLI